MGKVKKKTKKQLFYDELCRILWQNKSLDELWNEYVDFMDTQTIYKPAKKYKGKFIYRDEATLPIHQMPYVIIARKKVSDYYKLTDSAPSFGAYWEILKRIISEFKDEWCSLNVPPKWNDGDFCLEEYKNAFKKRFFELNPKIAELEATFQSIRQLNKVGIKNDLLEQRFKELTNNYEAKIIISIPTIEEFIDDAWNKRQHQLLREGKLNLKISRLKELRSGTN